MRLLFLPFFLLPVIEMVILIKVGGWIGVWNTLLLVILTAITGATLLRQQGLATLLRANERLRKGEIPAQEMVDGMVMGIGAVLLLTPGFVTDAMGLFCLFPVSRRWLVQRGLQHLIVQNAGFATTESVHEHFTTTTAHYDRAGHTIIDGEYSREEASGPDSSMDSLEKK